MINVLTMNLNSYNDRFGPWTIRMGMVREMVQNVCPDILAFQAVARMPNKYAGKDQAEQLAELFPNYPYAHYQPAMELAGGLVEGVAIISRFQPQDVQYRELSLIPDTEDNNKRALLHARFDLPQGYLHLFDAHFSWVDEQAEKNVQEALQFVKQFPGPALLVGDLNQPPDSVALESFRDAGWTDAWAELNPSEDGFTFFEGTGLVKRIDYAWVNSDLLDRLRSIRVISSVITGLDGRASDHDALLVSFDLDSGMASPC